MKTTLRERPAMTKLGPWFDVCNPGCCANFRGEKPVIAEVGSTIGLCSADARSRIQRLARWL